MTPLVLSLFPGIGLLDMAFEQEGFCVVRGPDVLWGGDVRNFHPPAGVFDGVIGGPPCQSFSPLSVLVRSNGHTPRFGNLIPEYERVVVEAQPTWFIMENVLTAPFAEVEGYVVSAHVLNNRYFGAEQNRKRRISFGTRDGRPLLVDVALFEAPVSCTTVTSSDGGGVMRGRVPFAVTARHAGHGGKNSKQYVYPYEEACELQGLPRDFLKDAPFTKAGKLQAVANGVPLPMGRAIAAAVRRAFHHG